MSGQAAQGRAEQQLLAPPRLDTFVAVVVVVITAGAFAAVAGHATLIRVQRLDEAWLRLMISGRSAPITATAKLLKPLGETTMPDGVQAGGRVPDLSYLYPGLDVSGEAAATVSCVPPGWC
jgi:hypothetical protein